MSFTLFFRFLCGNPSTDVPSMVLAIVEQYCQIRLRNTAKYEGGYRQDSVEDYNRRIIKILFVLVANLPLTITFAQIQA